jgi:hypothetical protein
MANSWTAVIVAAAVASFLAATPASAGDRIRFNQRDVEATRARVLDTGDPGGVLEFVLSATDPAITVYPTEGYYYFEFQNGPQLVKGNIRFDVEMAAKGKLAFAYYTPTIYGAGEASTFFRWMSSDDGLELSTVSPFEYRLNYRGIQRRVHIFDGTDDRNGRRPVGRHEQYLGPVFDESGVRFHLVFSNRSNRFAYVRNDNLGPAEGYTQLNGSNTISVGDRTSFVYALDRENDRYILIGVRYINLRLNNYFDGPFDQLPDRFMDGVLIQQLIEKATPSLRGRIGPRGIFLAEDDTRVAIAPYREYLSIEEFNSLSECLEGPAPSTPFEDCLKRFVEAP